MTEFLFWLYPAYIKSLFVHHNPRMMRTHCAFPC